MSEVEKFKVKFKDGRSFKEGFVSINPEKFIFEPKDAIHKRFEVASYRIVQTGFRKYFQFFAYMFYFRTSSGKVLYFNTLKARKVVKTIENIIY